LVYVETFSDLLYLEAIFAVPLYFYEMSQNVRFCLVNETFAGSFYLYVNVLEQAGGIVVLDGLSFFGGNLAFSGHFFQWFVVRG
jgi:hypothetical protein